MAAGSPVLVCQYLSTANVASGTATVAAASPAGVGLLVAVVASIPINGSQQAFTVSDTQGNTYTAVGAPSAQNGVAAASAVQMFLCPNAKALATSDSVTVNNPSSSSSQSLGFHVAQLPGIASSSPVDGTPVTGSGTTGTMSLGAVSAHAGGIVLVLYCYAGGSGATFVPGSGFTQQAFSKTTTSNPRSLALMYAQMGSDGSITPTATDGAGSPAWSGQAIAVLPAAAAPPATRFDGGNAFDGGGTPFDASSSNTPSTSSAAGFNGTVGLDVNVANAVARGSWDERTFDASAIGKRYWALSFRFRLPTPLPQSGNLGGTSAGIATVKNSTQATGTGQGHFDFFYNPSDGTLHWDLLATNFGQFAVAADTWYYVQAKGDFGSSTYTADVTINGQAQASIASSGLTPYNAHRFSFGSDAANQTYRYHVDDVLFSADTSPVGFLGTPPAALTASGSTSAPTTDSTARRVTAGRSAADTLTVTDAAARTAGHPRVLVDSVPTSDSGQLKGRYVVKPRPKGLFDRQHAASAANIGAVQGSVVAAFWGDCEPQPLNYVWDSIESQISALQQAGCTEITLRMAGSASDTSQSSLGTPAWVCNATEGPYTYTLNGITYTTGPWWDQDFQSYRLRFEAALAAKYDGDPRISGVFFTSSGVTFGGEWTTRPTSDPNAKATFLGAGYTITADQNAITAGIQRMAQLWTHTTKMTWLSVLFKGWDAGSNSVVQDQPFTVNTIAAMRALDPRWTVGTNNADATGTDPNGVTTIARNAGPPLHFQTASAGNMAGGIADLAQTLENLIGFEAMYVELPATYNANYTTAQLAGYDQRLRANDADNIQRPVTDNLTTSDTAARVAAHPRAGSDSVPTSDSGSATSSSHSFTRSGSSTTTVSDSTTTRVTVVRTATDAVPTADAAGRSTGRARAGADSLTVSDTAVRSAAGGRAAVDSVPTTDTASRSAARSRSSVDSVPTTDAAGTSGGGTSARSGSTSTPTTDAAGRVVRTSRAAVDGLTTFDAASRTTSRQRAAVDALTTSDSGSVVFAAGTVSLSRAGATTVSTLDASARGVAVFRSRPDTLPVADGATFTVGLRRSAVDTLPTVDVGLVLLIPSVTLGRLLSTPRPAVVLTSSPADRVFPAEV